MKKTFEHEIIILDGGMGRELERMGAPFHQPEWSALALMEGPDFVRRAHLNFIQAGAEVITTNSFAIVPFHIGEERFASEAYSLANRAGELARTAVQQSGRADKVRVAGSLPPLFGSYRPDLFDPPRAPEILAPLVSGLSPWVDLWLAETLGSTIEARAARAATMADARPFWVSFTLDDDAPDAVRLPRLRSGESVAEAVQTALEIGAAALLYNCSQPEVMGAAIASSALESTRLNAQLRLGVYANAFPPQPKDALANDGVSSIREDLGPAEYRCFAANWIEQGASILGGCCGIGPAHIAAIRELTAVNSG